MNHRARLDDPAGRKGKRLMAIRKTIGCGCHGLSRLLVSTTSERKEKAGGASNRELSFEPSWEHGRQ